MPSGVVIEGAKRLLFSFHENEGRMDVERSWWKQNWPA